MIQRLFSVDACASFVEDFCHDPDYSDPMLSSKEEIEGNLKDAVKRPENHVLGVFRDRVLTGLFVFQIEEDERYMEMLVGLSRTDAAYEEVAEYLQANFRGFQADFVFNPANDKLKDMLLKRNAVFYEEQQKMLLSGDNGAADTSGIEPYAEQYREQYIEIHDKDCYWTAEKVVEAKDSFRVLLAIDDGAVVGYLDVTHCHETNEVFDLFVRKEYRRRGWGRKLLTRAIKMNRPKGMILVVDVDNVSAISLYESLGFAVVPGGYSQTATWIIR